MRREAIWAMVPQHKLRSGSDPENVALNLTPKYKSLTKKYKKFIFKENKQIKQYIKKP